MSLKLVFVGVQGSGKGTYGKILSKELGIAHISTGDLLRSAEGELREKINSYTDKGNLIPDELMIKILKQRLEKEDCQRGFILDGFPRNLEQARQLDKTVQIDKIIEISLSDETATRRISGRWNCPRCGIAYNVNTEPRPVREGGRWVCPSCKVELGQRRDDADIEAVKKRIRIYHDETEPMLSFFRDKAVRIDGEPKIAEVMEKLREIVKS